MIDDERIKMGDLSRIGFCARGVKMWFESRGLDFGVFLKEGISVRELRQIGDALSERAVRSKFGDV